MSNTLADWLFRINSTHHKEIDLGLDRVLQVVKDMSLRPECPVITVGGTNGKGSTCAMLESIYSAAGYRVGLFSSPPLIRFKENFRVVNKEVSDSTIVSSLEEVDSACGDFSLTYFEYSFLAALNIFIQQQVDVIILEVGLGGRLVAVNVLDPSCAIVTNIGLDHLEYLGETRVEIGFEKEMREIVFALSSLERKILTSATYKEQVPQFMEFQNPICLDFLEKKTLSLDLSWIHSPSNTLDTLFELLKSLGSKRGIVFCNFKNTLDGVSEFLEENQVEHTCFYGGMEQIDRERSLIQFRNSSQRTLLATDLAARGIDIPGLDYIIHYEMPPREEEFTHRNGRTARMNSDGAAFCIKGKNDKIPEYARKIKTSKISKGPSIPKNKWKTIYISGGRKDKISKGDIVGLFIKKGNIDGSELGVIELKNDCAFVAVDASKASVLCNKLNNQRLKTKKVRISTI